MERTSAITAEPARTAAPATEAVVMPVLLALGLSHLLNDMIQAMLPAIYPVLKQSYALSFTQIGLITLAF